MKKQFLLLWLFLLALSVQAKNLDEGLKSFINQLNAGILAQSKNKVAVLDFANLEGISGDFGKYIAEELSTQLSNAQILSVVERRLLLKIIQEQASNLSPEFDESTAKQFGKILGVDAIITGIFIDFGNTVKINVRAINTQTGEVITAATCDVMVDDIIRKLLKRELPAPQVQPVPISQEVPKQTKPAEIPVSELMASNIIFSEDFNKYDVGDPIPSWGEGLTILKMNDGRKCLSTQMSGVHTVRIVLNFPVNFSIEMEFIGKHSRGGVDPTFTNSDGEPFKINMWGNAPSFQLPGNKYVNAEPWNTAGILKIIKRDTTFKIYWRDEFITSGSYNNLGNFIEYKFNLQSGDNITNIIVKSM